EDGIRDLIVTGVQTCALPICLPEAYPPPANPFLTDAPPLARTTLAQPAKVGLVWLAPVGSAVPPQAAQQRLVDKIKAQFAAGKRSEERRVGKECRARGAQDRA